MCRGVRRSDLLDLFDLYKPSSLFPASYSRHKCTVDVELGLKPVVTTIMAGPKVVFSLYSSFRQFEITGSSVLYLLSLDFANLFFLSICNLLQANYWNGR